MLSGPQQVLLSLRAHKSVLEEGKEGVLDLEEMMP
jgi:hypothetical protein